MDTCSNSLISTWAVFHQDFPGTAPIFGGSEFQSRIGKAASIIAFSRVASFSGIG
jgi:hypothetical protein